MHVLLVEDDLSLGMTVRVGLEQQGFAVDWQLDGASAEVAIMSNDYAALLLDMGVPKYAGMMLLQRIRAKGKRLPVVVVTTLDAIADGVTGVDVGADDFIVKPFDVQELSARLRIVMRRASERASSDIGQRRLQLDPAARTVVVDGKPITLTAREFSILSQLLEHRGKVLSKQQLQEALYGLSDGVDSNTVEVHVHHLRRKLGRELIKTMHGMGYMTDARIHAVG